MWLGNNILIDFFLLSFMYYFFLLLSSLSSILLFFIQTVRKGRTYSPLRDCMMTPSKVHILTYVYFLVCLSLSFSSFFHLILPPLNLSSFLPSSSSSLFLLLLIFTYYCPVVNCLATSFSSAWSSQTMHSPSTVLSIDNPHSWTEGKCLHDIYTKCTLQAMYTLTWQLKI